MQLLTRKKQKGGVNTVTGILESKLYSKEQENKQKKGAMWQTRAAAPGRERESRKLSAAFKPFLPVQANEESAPMSSCHSNTFRSHFRKQV